ncbi:MAG: PTS sugar transporter subunit IIC [Elusimicrobia bacterium]|nr:PTS sugar transporter subunit IIC [Elusimicrobiota bacterium]
MLNALITSMFAGLLELDNVQAGQFLLSRPAFAGPLLGWLSGCPLEGARIGLLIELVYMDFIPVGGVVPPNGLVAAATALLALTWAGLPESLAFFIGVFAGFLYGGVEYRLRTARSGWNTKIEAEVKDGTINIGRWLAGSLLLESAVTGAYIFFFSALVFIPAVFVKPAGIYTATNFAYSLMPWLGLSGLYFRFRTQVGKKG